MIPPRRLSAESFGNGVSYRVAVCRKRLRVNRTTPRAAPDSQGEPLHGGPDSIPTQRPNTYSSTPPSIAFERQTLSRQSEFAGVPGGEVGSLTEQKAEDA